MTSWKSVWSGRRVGSAQSLQDLLEVDGFDGRSSRIEERDFRRMVGDFARKVGLNPGESVMEVGCGAGAFLLALRDEVEVSVFGVDFSPPLIEVAKSVLGASCARVCDATEIPAKPRTSHVVAHSVFQYLDEASASAVLSKMEKIALTTISILDIPALETRSESEMFRAEMSGGQESYNDLYENQGLHHQYFSLSFFERFAESAGFSCERVSLFKGSYPQKNFRFDVIMRRGL